MKKVFLLFSVLFLAHTSFSQDYVFMQLIENKLLCREDRLVNFLETNSFVRNHRSFHRDYSANGKAYFTDLVYDNECYAIYRTNSRAEYKSIEKRVNELCSKETGPNKGEYYTCNIKRIYGVQVTLSGYQSSEEIYELKIYQNPGWEESTYPLGNK